MNAKSVNVRLPSGRDSSYHSIRDVKENFKGEVNFSLAASGLHGGSVELKRQTPEKRQACCANSMFLIRV